MLRWYFFNLVHGFYILEKDMLRSNGNLSKTYSIYSDLATFKLTTNAAIARFTKAGMIIFILFCKLEIITAIIHTR